MRKSLLTFVFFSLVFLPAFSQENPDKRDNLTIEERFIASDLKDKLKIITSVDPSPESYDLYKKALEYTVRNDVFYSNDPFFDEIYVRSASGMLIILNSSPKARMKAGSSDISAMLDFISRRPDPVLLSHLFRMKNLKYSPEIIRKAEFILKNSRVPFFSVASDIIVKNPVLDKLEILNIAMERESLSLLEKGELASRAMEAAFNYKVSDHRETETVKNLLKTCVDTIYELRWSEASGLVLRYFDQLIAYENKDAVKGTLLKTIKTLGILGTHEAAVRLSMYIGLINSFVEKGLDYDEDIILEVVSSLGQIGDLTAYENLSAVEKLGYSEEIISLSREAVSRLKISR